MGVWNLAMLLLVLSMLKSTFELAGFEGIVTLVFMFSLVGACFGIDYWLEQRGARMGGDDLDAAQDPYNTNPQAIVRQHQDKVKKNADGTPGPMDGKQ